MAKYGKWVRVIVELGEGGRESLEKQYSFSLKIHSWTLLQLVLYTTDMGNYNIGNTDLTAKPTQNTVPCPFLKYFRLSEKISN